MQLRTSTRQAYITFLKLLARRTTPFNMEGILRENEIDLKLGTFLKKSNSLINKGNSEYLASFREDQVEEVLNRFVEYRNVMDEKNLRDRTDLEYYRANKDYLVDTRTLDQISSPEATRIKEETRKAIIKEVSEYAAMAVKFNKTDIAGFITNMLNIK